MSLENRVDRIEEAILIMKDLLVSHDERIENNFERLETYSQRLENYFAALRESRQDFEFKLNALIDAQLRNEVDIAELKKSSTELKEASRSQLQRIEKLEND